MTIIGVMLSTALICTVVGMVATFRQSIIHDYKENTGDWHVNYGVRNEEQYDVLMNNAHVEKAGVSQHLGFVELGLKYGFEQYLSIYGCNKEFFSQMNIKVEEGRLPENPSEMLISAEYARTENAPKVGDTVTFEVGDRIIRTEEGYEYEYNGWSYADEEVFIPAGYSKYTIVGIALNSNIGAGYTGMVLDETFRGKYTDVFIRFDSPSKFSEYMDNIGSAMSAAGDGSYDYATNMLLRYEGGLNDSGMKMIVGLGLIISVIIMGTSIFIISNSFRISVEDKKTQFGMLASVGATKRQIRGIVFREGFYIFLIGTAAGLALGAFVIWVLDQIVNLLIGEMMSMEMIYTFPWWVAVFTVLLSAVTILLSALKPARDAARITPIEIIRGGSDIKLDPKKLGTKKITSRLFGIGGVIAEKNLKRSRKKYRTTVVSLVIAVAVFIAIAGFVGYGKKLVGEVYTRYDTNLVINYIGDQEESGNDRVREAYEKVRSLSGIKESFYGTVTEAHFRTDIYGSAELNAQMNEYGYEYAVTENSGSGYPDNLDREMLEHPYTAVEMIIVPEKDFSEYLNKLGVSSGDIDNAAVLADRIDYYEGDIKSSMRATSIKEGDTVEYLYARNDKKTSDDEEYETEWGMSSCRVVKLVDEESLPAGLGSIFHSEGGTFLLVSEKHFDKMPGNIWVTSLYVDAEDPGLTADTVDSWNNGELIYRINNLYEQQKGNDRMILVLEIFLYGFIIVITLIAVTNVINTVNTNMNLRRREFAMLRSIGMTQKDFSRMIRAEGILVSLKSVLFGLPLGAVLSYLVHLAVKSQFSYTYLFPWKAMVIAVFAVAFIVGIIMFTAVSRIRKQNIIEAIRVRNY